MINHIRNFLAPIFGNGKATQPPSFNHHINADIALTPIGMAKTSTKNEIRDAIQILHQQPGLNEVNPHGFGTNVSGDWQSLIKSVEDIAEHTLKNSKRVAIDLKVSFRRDKPDAQHNIRNSLAAVS